MVIYVYNIGLFDDDDDDDYYYYDDYDDDDDESIISAIFNLDASRPSSGDRRTLFPT